MKLLRIIRIVVSVACLVLATGLLAGYGMTFPLMSGWLERVQLLPAAMAFSLVAFVSWIIATLVFGRVYCSTVCPMGTFQDIMARTRGRRGYRYHPPVPLLRYFILAIVLVTAMLGIVSVAVFADPWGMYSRFCAGFVKPLWGLALGFLGRPVGIIMGASLAGCAVAVAVMIIIGAMAWRRGRLYCNTFCPVGTALGFVSRYSIYHFDIDTDVCTHCGRCERVCKAECINPRDQTVDGSRCVTCFDCVAVCKSGAMRYTYQRKQLAFPMMMKTPQLSAAQSSGCPLAKPAGCRAQNQETHETVSESSKRHN